jgi:rubrerythrin
METLENLNQEMVEVGEALRGRRNVLKAGMLFGAASAFAALGAALGRPASAFAGDKMKGDKMKGDKMKGDKMKMDKAGDAKILNVALGLEYQAIYAYDAAAGTGLLTGQLKDVALLFQSQHKEHAKLEEDAIRSLGATPVERMQTYDLGDLSTIKTDKDVLALALGLEQGAATAYMGVLKSLASPDIIAVAAGIGANEAQHAALLRFVLQQNPVPVSVVK